MGGVRLVPAAWLKRALPRSLLGRSLLMILLPLVLLQAVTLAVYYGNHINLVYRRLSGGVAGEIAFTLRLVQRDFAPEQRAWIIDMARHEFDLRMQFEPGAVLPKDVEFPNVPGPMDDDLQAALAERLTQPFQMDWSYDKGSVLVRVQLPDGVLDVWAPRKRVDLGTFFLFLAWVVGASLLLFAIAALFMRNQVRAIRRLAAAAEAFGMGRDIGAIRPEGASEVRKAAAAFNRMQERIHRFLVQRTEMLAGVSHDLRTPLTRLRLALAMLPKQPELALDVTEMTGDVAEMERMIEGYLAFARGEGTEQAELVDLSRLLHEVAAGARRAGAGMAVAVTPGLTLKLREGAARRAITNLVDNARRHATREVMLTAAPT
ncbi:MAG: HAMP domain-containing protein, partial [Acetobacteraceae bacterium]|nr:HAMP domain-containing protein [Acetobacteraceae bacterium]